MYVIKRDGKFWCGGNQWETSYSFALTFDTRKDAKEVGEYNIHGMFEIKKLPKP